LNAQANVECNGVTVNLTIIDFKGGAPKIVDGSFDELFPDADSSSARSADSPQRCDSDKSGQGDTVGAASALGTSATQSKIGNPKREIGLVGPMSNHAATPQLVDVVLYQVQQQMHEFARRWRDEHRGQWCTVPKLSGFCLLMKRAVYAKIGGLDERFGLGFFDDDDLAERARRAGFELAVAHDLFVHHFGSRTFAGNGVDAEELLDENAKRFAAK
jgi:hypothetical protein